jgi:hypothetical protein
MRSMNIGGGMTRVLARRTAVIALVAGSVLGAASGALAQHKIEAVYAITGHAPGSPKTAVPGTVAGTTDPRFTNFSELNRSPDGKTWTVLATTNATPATQDQLFLIGSGLSTTRFFQEGVTQINSPSDPTPEFFNLGTSLTVAPRINNLGQWAAGFRLGITGATMADDRLAIWDGTAFTVIKSGDPIPASGGGGTYGGSFNTATITSTGAAAFLATPAPNSAAFDSAFLANGQTRLIDVGFTIPSGQLTGTPVAWNDVDSNASAFQINADGTRYIALGEVGFLDTTTDKVAVVDGSVVVQEGFPVVGVGGNVTTISSVRMEPSGDWYIRGTSVTTDATPVSTTWIMKNGTVVARQRDPLYPGATENWASFRDVKGDNCGNYVINGSSDNTDGTLNDVLVYNGSKIIARESDPVDLNNDGTANDSLFLFTFQDRAVLLDDDFYYFSTRIKATATGTSGLGANSSLLRIRACRADFDNSGSISIDDIFIYINAWFANNPRANWDCGTPLNIDDIFIYINAWFAGC